VRAVVADVWPADSVLVVDEATQVSTRDAEKLARWATRTGTVLVFLGDPAQLGSVGAGGWFAHIVNSHGAPTLSTVYRQTGPAMGQVRAALAELRTDVPGGPPGRWTASPPTDASACTPTQQSCTSRWSTTGTSTAIATLTPPVG